MPPIPHWMLLLALFMALLCLVWRHAIGQVPLPGVDAVNRMFDKWTLGPLRLLDFMALLLLALHFGPGLARRLPRLRALELLGRASLQVFCAHLVMSLVALALLGAATDQRSWWIDTAVLVLGLSGLWATAWATRALERWRRGGARRVGPAARVRASGAPQ